MTQTVCSYYREFPAPDNLANYFLCFWTQTIVGLKNEYAHRVLPDGCIDIVFINDESPIVVGPWTESFVVRLAVGTKILGARLRPGCAASFLGVPGAGAVELFRTTECSMGKGQERGIRACFRSAESGGTKRGPG